MCNLVTTAMRTVPFRRRIDPYHSADSPGQLSRLSVPLFSSVLVRAARFCASRSRTAVRKRFSSSLTLCEVFRGVFTGRSDMQTTSGIQQYMSRSRNSLPENTMRGISHNSCAAMEANSGRDESKKAPPFTRRYRLHTPYIYVYC